MIFWSVFSECKNSLHTTQVGIEVFFPQVVEIFHFDLSTDKI